MNQEREARRFRQIATLERQLVVKAAEIRDSKAHTKELSEQYDALIASMCAAARDEGELPLLDMMDEPATAAKH